MKLPTWTIYFPVYSCPHCKRRCKVAFYGGRFKFYKVGTGRPRKLAAPVGSQMG